MFPEHRDVILTSVEKRMTQSVFDVIKDVMQGTFRGCEYYVGALANEGVGLASYHDLEDSIPADLRAEIEEIKDKIIAGEIGDTGCLAYPDWCPAGLYQK
jgi:basic membrane protein A